MLRDGSNKVEAVQNGCMPGHMIEASLESTIDHSLILQ